MSDDSKTKKVSTQFGIPVDLIHEAEGFAPLDTEPYPDNVQAVDIFKRMTTQWRVGMNGPVGLVYEALPTVFRMCRVAEEDEQELFDCLRVMEIAALPILRGD